MVLEPPDDIQDWTNEEKYPSIFQEEFKVCNTCGFTEEFMDDINSNALKRTYWREKDGKWFCEEDCYLDYEEKTKARTIV